MNFPAPINIKIISELIDAELIGNNDLETTGINEIHRVQKGDLVFVDHPKYYNKCLESAATFIIINTKEVNVPDDKILLVVADPFEAYLKIAAKYRPFLSTGKAISDSAKIGDGTILMPHVFIGNHVTIGTGCIIHPNVCIHDYSIIGNNVIIQSGTTIGGDAFYYNTKKNRDMWYKKMKSCGNVVIEDDVEIGAGCTIDRGVTAETSIGAGTKMDNLVHVGHDVIVGKNCLFAAQVGIAGGTIIEDGVTLWGQVGVNKTITIETGATVMGQSGVVSTIAKNKTYWGTPAVEVISKKREMVWVKRIPEMWALLKAK